MSEQSTTARRSVTSRRQSPDGGNALQRLVGAVRLFLAQIMDELRKVVRPTRQELTTYTTVVIVFVAAIMLFVFGLDTVITRLVFWLFAGS